MNPWLAAVLLVFCGFAVTEAQARPRTVPDKVTVIEQGVFTLEKLGPATMAGLWIAPDTSLGLKVGQAIEVKALARDRYGRTPVLLYNVGAKAPVQEQLLATGSAMVNGPAAAPVAWRKAETTAHAGRRGLWKAAPLKPDQAAAHRGEMVRVQGKVTHTYKSRAMHYINFGEDWKTDFSLRIPRAAWRVFGKDFTVADGACIHARGVVFLDNGPMIELTRPEQMEKLNANACAG